VFLVVLRRLAEMLFVLAGISVLVFLIFFATPGADPSARIAGRNASPETLQQVRREFGLDRPLWVQYVSVMKKLFVTRDLASFVNRGEPVIPTILAAAPVTLALVTGAALIWVLFAILVGVAAAATAGGMTDRVLMLLGLIGVSMPVFWVGSVANLVTQSRFHETWLFRWVPGGYIPFEEDPWLWFRSLVIPCITLAILYIGLYGRVLRAQLVETYREDFIRTARAKGLSEGRIMLHHALRSSMVGFVSMFGLDFGALVGGGALLTEVVFGLPGIGRLTYEALKTLDLPFIMAAVMYSAFFVVAANALVDLAYLRLDPRMRDAG
jgi:peptide/nickel transport system permease protein